MGVWSLGIGVLVGGSLSLALHLIKTRSALQRRDHESDFDGAKAKVWQSIKWSVCAGQIYLGDRLGIYLALRDACKEPDAFVTVNQVAQMTGLHSRWLREWMAQQASLGILILEDGEGEDDDSLRFRFPTAFAEVFANPESPHYSIPMIQATPALVNRARTVMPECFKTGLGVPYNEADIAEGIDRHHIRHIRDTLLPKVLPAACGGRVLQALERGVRVADLGCGGGNLVLAVAKRFPKCTVHGYEISEEALEMAEARIEQSGLTNAFVHDARTDPLGKEEGLYEVVLTYDVIHDATKPEELIDQVKSALAPGGVWILGDISSKDTLRENIRHHPESAAMFGFSTCLCMSSALSEAGGAGLGTLGFGVAPAKRMLRKAGFTSVRVLLEGVDNTRWFEVMEH